VQINKTRTCRFDALQKLVCVQLFHDCGCQIARRHVHAFRENERNICAEVTVGRVARSFQLDLLQQLRRRRGVSQYRIHGLLQDGQ
jgi:hypothetical protein